MHALLRLTALLALLAAPASAAAAKRVAIAPFDGPASVVPDSSKLQASLALRALDLVPADEVARLRASAGPLFGCLLEPRCLAQIGNQLHAAYVVTASISGGGEQWQAKIAVFDTAAGATATHDLVACSRCSSAAFVDQLVSGVADLCAQAERRSRGVLVVRTHPTGARVQIDERPAEVSDVELSLFAGHHVVAVSRGGEPPQTLQVQLGAGMRKELEFELALGHAASPAVAAVPVHPAWRGKGGALRIAGVAATALGGALGLASIPFFVLDGAAADAHGVFTYDTSGAKWGLAISGGVLLLGGVLVTLLAPRLVEHQR